MNKICKRIDKLRTERGWTVYRLAKESGLSESTVSKWFSNDIVPTIPVLEQICEAFNISLSIFFDASNLVEVTPDFKEVFENWTALTEQEKQSVTGIIKSYIMKNKANM